MNVTNKNSLVLFLRDDLPRTVRVPCMDGFTMLHRYQHITDQTVGDAHT